MQAARRRQWHPCARRRASRRGGPCNAPGGFDARASVAQLSPASAAPVPQPPGSGSADSSLRVNLGFTCRFGQRERRDGQLARQLHGRSPQTRLVVLLELDSLRCSRARTLRSPSGAFDHPIAGTTGACVCRRVAVGAVDRSPSV
eukprot:scaffold36310_cov118-Isochrysis_galbana.AAC.8